MQTGSATQSEAGVPRPVLSLIVPVFNEELMVVHFIEEVRPILQSLNLAYEVVFINDGSSDGTLSVLERLRAGDRTIKIIELSRNFGKEIAMSVGLDYCSGDAVIPIDADLQDPPEIIPQLVEKWREGFDIVLAIRADRSSDSCAKRITAHFFYRIFNAIAESPIPEHAGDFRLMDGKVVQVLRLFPERNRFMKGIFNWPGFRRANVYFTRKARANGGSRWSYWRLWNFALDALFSFSVAPLKVWGVVGMLCSLGAFLFGGFMILKTVIVGAEVPGYPSLIVVVLFMGGMQLLCLGVVGEYVGKIYKETKGRPLYVVYRTVGIRPSVDLARDRQPLIIDP